MQAKSNSESGSWIARKKDGGEKREREWGQIMADKACCDSKECQSYSLDSGDLLRVSKTESNIYLENTSVEQILSVQIY